MVKPRGRAESSPPHTLRGGEARRGKRRQPPCRLPQRPPAAPNPAAALATGSGEAAILGKLRAPPLPPLPARRDRPLGLRDAGPPLTGLAGSLPSPPRHRLPGPGGPYAVQGALCRGPAPGLRCSGREGAAAPRSGMARGVSVGAGARPAVQRP